MLKRRVRSAAVTALLVSMSALAACSLLDPLDNLTGSDASVPVAVEVPDASADQDASPPTVPAGPCIESPHTDAAVTEGFLCGVGACRKRLTGPMCRIETFPDGGKRSPCATAFPVDVGGDGKDNDCNGVVDDGYASASPEAGISCKSCAFAHEVQRLANGTLETAGGAANRAAHKNTADCINSDLCAIGAAQWTRNVSFTTCTTFCKNIGATCKPACATTIGMCNSAAVGLGFGTYANDYRCTVPFDAGLSNPGSPLTGDCNRTFPGVIDPSADFNLFCCCEL